MLAGAGLGAAFAAARHIRIGLQLFSVRDQCERNLSDTLASVRRIG